MSILFHKSFSFQSASSIKESGLKTPSSFSSASETSLEQKLLIIQKSNLNDETCQKFQASVQNDVFEEVKLWFEQKNIKIGNPEEIIQKAKITQRQLANNKVADQKEELTLSSSSLRERRLKKSLTLLL